MIGRTLGGYRIVEQVGMGGMATVYKAYDASTDRYVALKTLPEQYSKDPQFVERFRREAKAIAKLEHLHILPLFAYGEDEGVAYLAMRYLPAGTLSNFIQQKGQMPLVEAVRLLNQIASALDHAHANGVLHRDIKPSNVLVDKDANAYLTDFGIARMVEGTIDLTGDAILGTPQYMSPEQCQGKKDLTPASDQYSLGVVLYEMVTGRVPFQAETPLAVIIMQINGADLPLPSTLRPDLPEAAERVILKALSRNPADRYPSCEALARAFSQAVDEQSAKAATRTAQPAPLTAQTPAAVTVSKSLDDDRTFIKVDSPARAGLSPTLIGGAITVAIIVIGGIVFLASRPSAVVPTVIPVPTQAAAIASATSLPPTPTPIPATATTHFEQAGSPLIVASPTAVQNTSTPSAEQTQAVVSAAASATTVSASNPVLAIVPTLMAQGDPEAAIKLLTPAIAQTPKDAQLYFLRGQAYIKNYNAEEGIADFTQAITLAPDLAEAYVQRAIAYYSQDKRPEALTDISTAIKLRPDQVDWYGLRGRGYRDANELDKALADFDKTIELDPSNAKWYAERATTYSYHGEADKAIIDLTKAIELDPKFVDAYTQRGESYRWSDQHDLALADYMKARAIDPNNFASYRGAVENYLMVLDAGASLSGYDLDAALSDANKAVDLSRSSDGTFYDANIFFDRGQVHNYRNESDAAIEDFTQAIKLNAEYPEVYIDRGNAYTNVGKYDAARSDFDHALQLKSDAVEALQGRIEAYLMALDDNKTWKDYDLDTALADANAALIIDNGNAVSYLIRGKVYNRKGDNEKALADLNQTISLSGDMAWGYEVRGIIYGAMKKTDLALADFKKALELAPDSPWYYVDMGDAFYIAGRKAEALTAYQTYVKQVGESEASDYVTGRIAELQKSS